MTGAEYDGPPDEWFEAQLRCNLCAERGEPDSCILHRPAAKCPVHVGVTEPCPTCNAYIAAGL